MQSRKQYFLETGNCETFSDIIKKSRYQSRIDKSNQAVKK